MGVRDWPACDSSPPPAVGEPEPDEEVAVATLTADPTLLVERGDRLVAAIELVSPRNKDRAAAQTAYAAAYTGYLLRGVHLLLVDVHRRPAGFSFADQIARELGMTPPGLPSPFMVGYRVGGPPRPGGGSWPSGGDRWPSAPRCRSCGCPCRPTSRSR